VSPRTATDRLTVSLTVDIVVLTIRDGDLVVLLVRRARPPFEGKWAIPGGFVDPGESLVTAARRELEEETHLRDVSLEQLHCFGDPHRDPRGRVVSVAYLAAAPAEALSPEADDDAAEVGWFPVDRPPPLAFDHDEILGTARRRLREGVGNSKMAFRFLPPRFTLGELQRVYEIILGKKLDKRNFRRKMLSLGILRPRDEMRRTGRHRPARLYSLAEEEGALPRWRT
jgi:8-oxo-dGTP diphosphatase